MERKRVAGRFAAEDKGEVAKKSRAAAPQREERRDQQEVALVELGGLDRKDRPQTSKQREKSLFGSLLKRWRKEPKIADKA